MSQCGNSLFNKSDLHMGLRAHLDRVPKAVDAIPDETFMATNDDALFEHVYSKMEVLPLEIDEEGMRVGDEEVQVDVRRDFTRAIFDNTRPCMVAGIRVTVTIPFTGNSFLWDCQPSSYGGHKPCGVVKSQSGHEAGTLEISLERPSDTLTEEELKKAIGYELESIRSTLARMKGDIEQSNAELKQRVRDHIAFRRQKLAKHSKIIESLNIPLKQRAGSPSYTTLPIQRRIVRPLPTPAKETPEQSIAEADYYAILSIIRHAGRSFEATPETFAVHGEEALRNIVLANLNSVYEGGASGERFRGKGKTDICIEDKNRAAFVGECKVWSGPKEISTAMDQLLGYHTWRDCKSALIVFNKSVASFAALGSKLEAALAQHENCLRQIPTEHPGEWRFQFRSANDPDHQIAVHVFFFNVYAARST